MNLTESKKKEKSTRILLSRFRILNNHGFFGILLLNVAFGLDENCETAYTDGYAIRFSPKFLDDLNNSELDFVMMHEIMHIALKHCFRGKVAHPELFNVACDIVVNSNILFSNSMNYHAITLRKYGVAMHLAPDGKEGYLYTAEEVYKMLVDKASKESIFKNETNNSSNESSNKNGRGNSGSGGGKSKPGSSSKTGGGISVNGVIDDHSHWDIEGTTNDRVLDEWDQRIIDAYETISITEKNKSRGIVPLGVERLVNKLKKSTINWKELLNDFITFEVNDYSFLPPDRRFDGPFFMPDFNEENEVENLKVLFMIDTSGSMTDDELTEAYSEIKGAIDQKPHLEGYLGFFDSKVYEPKSFENVDDLLKIKPLGGGGTCFAEIFRKLDYLIEKIGDTPQAIIILTDGYDTFPKEEVRRGIPVLWIINNEDVTPPWGIIARIIKEK